VTLEEMRAKLDALGIPHDQWGGTPGGEASPIHAEKSKVLLLKLRDVLLDQVQKDKETVADLHVTAQRLKHGGGV